MAAFSLRLYLTATSFQIATYLLGISLFSIAFLVFLNSTVSFVITERIGQRDKVGDAVGSLGFADELVALIACPIWGILSDRIGVRAVAVIGYSIVGMSLWVFVQAKNVYPQLLLARLFFSLGGAATSTMVTAVLPAMTHESHSSPDSRSPTRGNGHNVTPSISSELTITPARFQSQSSFTSSQPRPKSPAAATSQLAGFVGMFTGIGALVALLVFLPLPAKFQRSGISAGTAVADAFYVVGAIAIAVAVFVFFGLRNLPGEEEKGWASLVALRRDKLHRFGDTRMGKERMSSYTSLLLSSVSLGFRDVNIGLGYLGGFVARASSVAISLFIPLFTNAYFISSGLCPSVPDRNSPESARENCRRAYAIAAALSGTSQLVALLCAPLFGYLSGRYARYNAPLILAASAGIAGYTAFGLLNSPDPGSGDGSPGVFFIVALLGISQIGAIVCSLGLLGRGIHGSEEGRTPGAILGFTSGVPSPEPTPPATEAICSPAIHAETEASPLLPSHLHGAPSCGRAAPRSHLKGSIAGIYSLAGGAGILLLTKVGGLMFDRVHPGSPFFLMAGFNSLLLSVGLGCAFVEFVNGKSEDSDPTSLG